MKNPFPIGTAVLVGCLSSLLCATATQAKPAPEFGPSIQFERREKPVQLSDFRGKGVLLVYFQSW